MRPGEVNTDERPFVLIWELTQACDLACDHCRADAVPDRHPDELTTAEAKALLDDARAFADGQLVVFSGGDPLKRPDAIDLVEYGIDIGLNVTMTPSGTRSLTTDRIDELAEVGLKRMALSLDGASPASHDAFRGEEGSFEETVAAARDARAAGLPLQINTTVCEATVDDLPAIRDLVADLGVVLWSVFFLVPVGRGRFLDPISPERAEEVMAWLYDTAREEPFAVKTTEAPHYRRVAIERARAAVDDGGRAASADGRDGTDAPPVRAPGITAGDGFAFVSHLGDVFPSGFLPLSAGNVRDRSLVALYRDSELFRTLRDENALDGKCGACPYRAVCGGSRSRAYAATGDPLGSDPLCAFVPDGYDGPLPWDGDGESADAD